MRTKLKSHVFRAAVTLILLFATGAVIAVGTEVTLPKDTPARSGPGSFYDMVVLLSKGSKVNELETKDNWSKISYNDNEMWVTASALKEQQKRAESSLKSIDIGSARADASPTSVTAAIKGFWTRFTGADKSSLVELPVNGYNIPVNDYLRFRSARLEGIDRRDLHKDYKLNIKYTPPDLPFQRELSLGYTSASAVADAPLIEYEAPIVYIHSVGWYLAESTKRYDMRFNFYILDTDLINAISCPGGYILLTRGLLEILEDESELAALLAHEMAHVIAGHGLTEVLEQKKGVDPDDAFAALDNEIGGRSETEEGLLAIANRAVSFVKAPKLNEYEFQADELTLRYMARSGYDLDGLFRLLHKLEQNHNRNVDIFDLNYRNHPDFKERISNLKKYMRTYRKYSDNRAFQIEYQQNMVF